MKVGDRVEKISGVNQGCRGVVRAVRQDGDKLLVKVDADESNITLREQDSCNFRIITVAPINNLATANGESENQKSSSSWKVGMKVQKTKGEHSGATGEVIRVVVGENNHIKLKVKCDDANVKFGLQSSLNFQVLQEIIVSSRDSANSANASKTLNSEAKTCSTEAIESKLEGPVVLTKSLPPKSFPDTISVGDRVQKRIGSNKGVFGLVIDALEDDENGLRVRVRANDGTMIPLQRAENFRIVSKAAKQSDHSDQAKENTTIPDIADVPGDTDTKSIPERINSDNDIISLGDRVQKRFGTHKGSFGVVEDVVESDEEGLRVRVRKEDGTLLILQRAENYRVIIKAVGSRTFLSIPSKAESPDLSTASRSDLHPREVAYAKGISTTSRSDNDTISVGDRVQKRIGSNKGVSGVVENVVESEEHGLRVRVRADDSSMLPLQSAENYRIVSKAAAKQSDQSDQAKDENTPDACQSHVEFYVGDIVCKLHGQNKGKLGIVRSITVTSEGETKLKVQAEDPDVSFSRQRAGNFNLVRQATQGQTLSQLDQGARDSSDDESDIQTRKVANGISKVYVADAKSVSITNTSRSTEQATKAADDISKDNEQATDAKGISTTSRSDNDTISVGDRVQKRIGSNKGVSGVVENVVESEEHGLRVRVRADDSSILPLQSAENYRIVSKAAAKQSDQSDQAKEMGTMRTNGSSDYKEVILCAASDDQDSEEFQSEDKAHNDVPSLHEKESETVEELSNQFSNITLKPVTVSDLGFPVEFTKKTIRELCCYNASDNTYNWGDNEYTSAEWTAKLKAWQDKYPNVVESFGKEKRNPFETESVRIRATTSRQNIQFCWDELRHTNKHIPSDLQDVFRVDMYGNVVSIESSDGALCKFDIDHLFPWSRGGKSIRSNFAAVQWDANRRVKNDKMIPFLKPEDLQCGLSPQQFAALWNFAIEKVKVAGGGRRDIRYEKDRLIRWLTGGPKKGFSLSNFRELVGGTTDGRTLWMYLEQHDENQRLGNTNVEVPRIPQLPRVFMRIIGSLRVECFGSTVQHYHDDFKSAFFSWDGDEDRKCYWKKAKNEEEEILAANHIQSICQRYDLQLIRL